MHQNLPPAVTAATFLLYKPIEQPRNFLCALQVQPTASVSYVLESASRQLGAAPGTARLPHLVIRPPGLREVTGPEVDAAAYCLLDAVSPRSIPASLAVFCGNH